MGVLSTIILAGMLACIMLGAIYFRVWLNDRPNLALLFFSLTSFSLSLYAAGELSMMHAKTIDEFIRVLYWTHLPTWVSHVSFALFVWFYLRAGKLWLIAGGIGLRTLATFISLLSPYSINFTDVTGLKFIDFYGETLAVAIGTRNPLMTIGHLGTLFLLAYCVDAAITVWNRGERQLARWFGFSVVFFIGGRLADTFLVMWGIVSFPLTTSPFFMGIVFAMAWELATAPKQARELKTKLEKSNDESLKWLSAMNLASNAGDVGVWIRNVDNGSIWANQEYRTIFGFLPDQEITMEHILERVHPDDRESFILDLEKSFLQTEEVSQELRLVLPGGKIRSIKTRKRFERPLNGPAIVFGAVADVTDRQIAEEKAHEMGGKMIKVLELERARLARELHDDLSQRLALLSIELNSLNRSDIGTLEDRISRMADRINAISADVHRISYELHPARLEQLGLASAIRGFCREVSEAQGVAIDLAIGKLPRDLSKEITLCIYRVIQEAVQNVVKHSGADKARVELGVNGKDLVLVIFDTGAGFDPDDARIKDSLGLISMQERMISVGGTLRVNSHVGQGTVVEGRIAVPTANVDETDRDEIIELSASNH